jgi:molybdate-binding protein
MPRRTLDDFARDALTHLHAINELTAELQEYGLTPGRLTGTAVHAGAPEADTTAPARSAAAHYNLAIHRLGEAAFQLTLATTRINTLNDLTRESARR